VRFEPGSSHTAVRHVTARPLRHCDTVTSRPGQLSLLPSAGREMSTGQSAAMLCRCGWGVKAGWLIPFVDKRVGGMWQVQLCDPSLTRAVVSALEVSSHEKALYRMRCPCFRLSGLFHFIIVLHLLAVKKVAASRCGPTRSRGCCYRRLHCVKISTLLLAFRRKFV